MLFTIEGSSYSYERIGKGDPVLLLHGFTGSKENWNSLGEALSENYQVIKIDLPGHGKTKSEAVSMEQCCHHLKEFLKYIKVEEAHVIGYSMGGRLALSFAMTFPEFVKSLVLESSSPGLQSAEERKQRQDRDEKLAQRILNEGVESFVQFWENIPLFDTQKSLPSAVRQEIQQERLSQQAQGLADSLRFMGTGSQASWWKDLKQVKIPSLLLVGELDPKFVKIGQEMNENMSQSEIIIFKGVGHSIHVEAEDQFNEKVKHFLNNIKEDL